MTINDIMSVLKHNYKEISPFDHVDEWSRYEGVEGYSLCTVVNDTHRLTIQARVKLNDPEIFELESSEIEEIYISYLEDPENRIQAAYKLPEEGDGKLYYIDIRTVDFDMGWV